MITPVILSGGAGTRLWPLSRAGYPKQFLPLTDEQSLFQLTLQRLSGLAGAQPALVICNDDHRFLIAEQARAIDVALSGIVLEPLARNTAPAIALAALRARAQGDTDPLMLVLPSDHVFADAAAFHAAVQAAVPAAAQGKLVTFGIVPGHAETGYGYIKAGPGLASGAGFAVERFVEKPDQPTAERYLAEGTYYWNSGMFLFKASVFLAELARFAPDMLAACEAEGVPAGPINDLHEVFADPQVIARGMQISPDGVPGVRSPMTLRPSASSGRRSGALSRYSAYASSKTRIGASARKARAMATRWRSPPDSFTPRSPTRVS